MSGRLARRAGGAVVGLIALVVSLCGCGVPEDGNARFFDESAIPFGLADPTTTTAATTSTQVAAVTSTSTTVAGEAVQLYFAIDAQFIPVTRWLPKPVTPETIITALTRGPQPGEATQRARSVLNEADVKQVGLVAGVVIVELAPRFTELPSSEQRLAVAQIVLTLTGRPGVGQVNFQVNRQPAEVPRADGTLAKFPVSRDDYSSLILR